MIKLGEYNKLRVVKLVDFGVYLDGGEYWGEILLPRSTAPEDCKEGDELEVFVYFDSEDRIIATMTRPKAVVGDFKVMKVVSVSRVGAFMDWGLRKDLLVPFREMRDGVKEGQEYLVYLNKVPAEYEPGEEVSLIVGRRTDVGYMVVVNKTHEAMIYENEIFQPLSIGQELTGYVKQVRKDGKIDCILQRNDGHRQIDSLAARILDMLRENGGRLPVCDTSDPELIYELFGCSKKNYKKAVGALFRQRKVYIGAKELILNEK